MKVTNFELAQAVHIGLTILSHRVLTLLALLMTFGLFSWAMMQGTVLHFAMAAAFGVCIFLPILFGNIRKPEITHGEADDDEREA
jgi:hypothetical protein